MSFATSYMPRDRTRREHVGQLDRIVWEADDESACIARLTDGSSIIGPASASRLERGVMYTFMGRWEEARDSKYGPQFRFTTFVIKQHQSPDALVKYLSKTCRNVGEATAKALYSEYGSDAARKLREEPAAVASAGIMSESAAKEAAADLQQFARFEQTRIDLHGLFAGRGFPGKLIDRAISKWGVAAPEVIRARPFSMMVAKLPGCGFKRCDKLYLDLGKPATALKRSALACWHSMREDRTGSTWLDAKDVAKSLMELIPGADPIRSMRLLLRSRWANLRRDGDARYISPNDRARAEQLVADNVRRLLRSPSRWPTDRLAVGADGTPSEHQVAELTLATKSAVGCFVGGPGSGKTTTLSFLLQLIIADYGRQSVAVVAPTGKAAVRAGESLRARGVDLAATTIHRVLEIGRNGHDDGGWGFLRNRYTPLEQRFVIVDESSMVDVQLMADLLEACTDGTQVLFVGDPYQLPPVGHGAPLRDLLASRVVSVGELTEIRRNSGSIVRACASIKSGSPVEFPPSLNLDADDKLNIKIVECDQTQVPQTVEAVLKALTRFDRVWETQVITGLNDKSDSSRTKLNTRLARLLNPDGRDVKANPFRVGDKIICKRNASLKVVVPTGKSADPQSALNADWYHKPAFGPQEWYVANGEIGRVVAVNSKSSVVRFGGADVPLVTVPVGKPKPSDDGEQPQADGGCQLDFQPAWAITVHSSQGSEWPCVVCVIDDAASQIADRNYWYTAISRARSLCILVGPRGVFEKQVKRQAIDRRRTFLTELVSVPLDESDVDDGAETTGGRSGAVATARARYALATGRRAGQSDD